MWSIQVSHSDFKEDELRLSYKCVTQSQHQMPDSDKGAMHDPSRYMGLLCLKRALQSLCKDMTLCSPEGADIRTFR